jgi:hypothetical protein
VGLWDLTAAARYSYGTYSCGTVQLGHGAARARYSYGTVQLRHGTAEGRAAVGCNSYGTVQLRRDSFGTVQLRHGTATVQLRYGTATARDSYGMGRLRHGTPYEQTNEPWYAATLTRSSSTISSRVVPDGHSLFGHRAIQLVYGGRV